MPEAMKKDCYQIVCVKEGLVLFQNWLGIKSFLPFWLLLFQEIWSHETEQ